MTTFYINPTAGNDTATGTQSDPFKTLTQALQQATTGTTIQLAAGTYTANSGEIFPLVIESEITIIGDETNKGSDILIAGSGEFTSPTFSAQNITFYSKIKPNCAVLPSQTLPNAVPASGLSLAPLLLPVIP